MSGKRDYPVKERMTNRFRVSSTLSRRLEDLGVSPSAVLRRGGLPIGLFNQEKILVSTEELFALHRGIAQATEDDPALGLKLGAYERFEHYDPNKIAALAARSFRDSIERLSRYKQLTCPEEILLIDRNDECVIQFAWLLASEPEPPLLVDVCFAWIVALGQHGTGRPLHAKQVEFQRAPSNREMYEAHFHCQVKFNCAHNALVFSKADVDLPFVTHNADLLAVVAPQLEAELNAQLIQKNFGEQAKAILKQLLAGRRPGVQDLAREMHLSTRTLQRRLTDESLTFQHLLDEARRELARHYLLHSSRELNETAYLLGYEDANSFYRAFQQWEGTSPGQWRLVHKDSQPSRRPRISA
jgi:AraC-like DNA-binding protein